MKNPFVKQNNNALAISVALGSVAAGAAAYLFLTEKGSGIRQRISGLFAKKEEVNEHATDYMQKPRKHRKTDREELLHHAIIPEQPHITN